VSAVSWWYEDDADLDYDAEPCPTGWSGEALVIANGIVSWSAAASVFDFDE
jgi:hypothetical protein